MSEVTSIGRCIGCDRGPRRVEDGICQECIEHPKRGREWARRAHRCRTEPDFALKTYSEIRTPRGRKLFVALFGLPPGAPPPEPTLQAVPEPDDEPEPAPARLLRLVR